MRKGESEPKDQSISEYGEFKVGGYIDWIDDSAKALFTKPAYGYGDGPFEVKNIIVDRVMGVPHDPNKKPYSNRVMFEINTPKGQKKISADYFKNRLN